MKLQTVFEMTGKPHEVNRTVVVDSTESHKPQQLQSLGYSSYNFMVQLMLHPITSILL